MLEQVLLGLVLLELGVKGIHCSWGPLGRGRLQLSALRLELLPLSPHLSLCFLDLLQQLLTLLS